MAAQQSPVPFEVIVIDNASTDATPALLARWCAADARFRTAHEPRVGLSRGKNAGIRESRAPLLLFTDDDVRVDPGWVASYHRLFADHRDPLLLAGGSIVPIPHDLGPWPGWLSDAALPDAGLLHHRDERELQRFEYVWGANMAVPRRVFEQLGGWDETIGVQGEQRVMVQDSQFFEDTELQDRIRKAGGRVWFCPAAVIFHRVDRNAVTPRRVATTAFARGGNDLWAHELRQWGEPRAVPRRNALRCLLGVTWGLLRWATWLRVFRWSRTQRSFEAMRQAAFASARWLESLQPGRDSTWLYRRVARFVFLVRAALLRLTPDTP